MDINLPVSSIMTTNLKTVSTDDAVSVAYDIFSNFNIHHVPVINNKKIVGMVSSSDILLLLNKIGPDSEEPYLNELKLKNYTIKEIMTKAIFEIGPTNKIREALEIFKENKFHALPICENGSLVGIVTTHDIISELLNE